VCGVHGNVVRILFPLTIQDTKFDEAFGVLEEVPKERVGVKPIGRQALPRRRQQRAFPYRTIL
jgi:hypothetical protein